MLSSPQTDQDENWPGPESYTSCVIEREDWSFDGALLWRVPTDTWDGTWAARDTSNPGVGDGGYDPPPTRLFTRCSTTHNGHTFARVSVGVTDRGTAVVGTKEGQMLLFRRSFEEGRARPSGAG
ncbi:hypothetical protein G6045_18660 [Streptomyces sp. YC504]|uniref:Uncharacterized protein n=1 Tax=Streptomyces mesophilus TaxID=1775132 RepID=A0A6G4XJE1_9ACTN|nr:hypothetical protein [Streptomyces mesophilus]NGO77665.1 hypothetical protein [Streptomyces mesophilus]